MTDSDRLAEQIEQQERWLAGLNVDGPAPGNLDEVKRRVRLALDEAWLAEQRLEPSADRALAAVKARLAAELVARGAAADPALARPEPVRRVYRFVSTFAAAAALLLAAGLGFWSASSVEGRASFEALDDLAAVMQRQPDEFETEWEALDQELTALENTFVRRFEATWDETLLDTLDEDIDDLTLEIGLSPDVS